MSLHEVIDGEVINYGHLDEQYEQAYQTVQAVTSEVKQAVHLRSDDLRAVVAAAMICEHVIFEGEPGTGKTVLAKAMATAMGGKYKRVQGTPDIMPSDITGTSIYNPGTREFDFLRGPVFSNVLLADELNRMPSRSQSALLEPMQEREVTVMGETYKLESPFIVLATQNPQEIGQGTQPLTHAQLDRFIIGVPMPPHSEKDMRKVLELQRLHHEVQPVSSPRKVVNVREVAARVATDSEVEEQSRGLVVALRKHKEVDPESTVLGGSRPALNILKMAQAAALSYGRRNVETEDIAFAAKYVLPHRVGVGFEREGERNAAQEIVKEVINKTV